VVGAGARRLLPEVLPAGVERVAVVTQENVEVELDAGVPSETFVVEDGEAAKTLASVEQLCRDFARFGLSRSDAVVALGGGVVSDVAGFAAAVYHRGIAYVNVATTLLAQVDAAIGGKTGVNLPEGKNLVGAFWQPAAVLCDTQALGSLPAREWSSGRGEMAKYAFLGDGLLGQGRPGATILGFPLDEHVARCVAIKAAVVSEDERDSGPRVILNYGHTLAHALEASSFGPEAKWDLRHGEAVAIGLVFAAMLARRLDRIDDERVALHRRVVAGFDLYADLPVGASARELVEFMARDKKAHHDLTFVLDGPNGVEPVHHVDEADVLATLTDMGCAP
jgi:5-deoxy-5-amino-3-dehydroquinate synthase